MDDRSDLEPKEKEENIFFTWDNLLLLFSLMIITKRFSFSTESFHSGRTLELRFKLIGNKKYNNIHLRIYLTYSRHSSLSLFQEWGRDFFGFPEFWASKEIGAKQLKETRGELWFIMGHTGLQSEVLGFEWQHFLPRCLYSGVKWKEFLLHLFVSWRFFPPNTFFIHVC